ncbi:hypothetical protein [Abyssicoccus albus]|uniref:hypothetical protein n=1 Tax=Abyssicoccus albus TaxID=1817405 RepID=UPI00097E2E30|nr:hypothetical protein [Abyssicoccus albus]AQL56402.1 hypothetical protein BVH56_05445 [Abyssicoccus albus]
MEWKSAEKSINKIAKVIDGINRVRKIHKQNDECCRWNKSSYSQNYKISISHLTQLLIYFKMNEQIERGQLNE